MGNLELWESIHLEHHHKLSNEHSVLISEYVKAVTVGDKQKKRACLEALHSKPWMTPDVLIEIIKTRVETIH